MQLQFTTHTQCLSLCQWHGVVELEDVVGGLILILRETVGQIYNGRACTKVVGHLGGGGAVVQLVGQSQALGVLLVEETLVVDTSAE